MLKLWDSEKTKQKQQQKENQRNKKSRTHAAGQAPELMHFESGNWIFPLKTAVSFHCSPGS